MAPEPSSSDRFDGRVAMVTGGASGIGAATARLLAARGAAVVVADVQSDAAAGLAAELGRDTSAVMLDVTVPEAWTAGVAHTVERHGRVDVLVNNAGAFALGSLIDTTLETFERLISVNQVGCFLGMKSVVGQMREVGGGAIVNTVSAAGLRGNAGLFAYTATKWALRGMTRTAAVELGAYGIRVNAVLPGAVDTPMTRPQGAEAPGRQEFFRSLPVPRQGQPDDIAEMICFLASDRAAYCTGAEFVVDGGLTTGAGNPPRRDVGGEH